MVVAIDRFLADPLEGVPTEVIDFLAGQRGVADASCVKKYAQRCLVLRTCSGPTYRRGCPHRREAASHVQRDLAPHRVPPRCCL